MSEISESDDGFERLGGPEHYLRGQEMLAEVERQFAGGEVRPSSLGCMLPADALAVARAHLAAAQVAVMGALLVSGEHAVDGGQVLNWAQVLGMRVLPAAGAE